MIPFKLIKRLLLIPKCTSCGERLKPIGENTSSTYGKLCFCESCHRKWLTARATSCPNCGNIAEKCLCHSDFFKKFQQNIPALCFYDQSPQSVEGKIIFTAKRVNDKELFEFLALELIPSLTKTLSAKGIEGENCIFTWIPRKRSSISKYGFDQGKRICEEVAKGFGGKPCQLFIRIGGKEQKNLKSRDRIKNADRSIILNYNASFICNGSRVEMAEYIQGKHIVLIDDVLTTGATLQKGVSLLKDIGADVTVACLAKTPLIASKSKNTR
jgi:predicted amidophosphoribosyltransferase